MIKLNDILKFNIESLNNTKIRFMTIPSKDIANNPIEHYKKDPSKITDEWFLWKHKKQNKPFKKGQIGLGFLKIATDQWLFVTAQYITKELNIKNDGIFYEGEKIEEYSKYFGRIVVNYHNTVQQLTRRAIPLIYELELLEILSDVYDGEEFPGYENISLSFNQLETIIKNKKKDWITALKNQKAVYLITDLENGFYYVGSAYGEEMILQRWSDYVSTGHGGNKLLKKLIEEKRLDYIKKNFQFSILETYNKNIPDEKIIERENWWKKALNSKKFGYNIN